ncbi:MAG TPA: fumarylacetoacetate hydrolase family protein, partial [Chitinophagaceae bacterium]|nr:fumarylacetoacetate hydrolase family protein [Chitinophagaceae bacterium]
GIILQTANGHFIFQADWDQMVNAEVLHADLAENAKHADKLSPKQVDSILEQYILPPIGSQEVWAAGVTYMRSRDARMEEAKAAGGGDFYDKVYGAERPELFFKALPHRVAGHGQAVYIREDSSWNVPEPELTLFINSRGEIRGYTAGNDMSSRSIEGENPLYLPQAKVYERSAALGPCLYVPESPLPPDTAITMTIYRKGKAVFTDSIKIDRMKRSLEELADYLYRGCDFPQGSYLMTGTCLVPDNDFTLMENDVTEIDIEHIGKLVNTVETYRKK